MMITFLLITCMFYSTSAQDVFGCGGFVKSEVEINFSLIEVKLYTKQGSLKYQTECAPTNGYYMIPVYDKGDYVLKVEPPPGWTFEPESYNLHIDGVNDKCSRAEDNNFQFTGFGVVGRVVSRGQYVGSAGVTLTLKKKDKPEVLKTTTTTENGDYTFQKVIPGEYVIEASHPVWRFDTAKTLVTVARETGNAGRAITLVGYDVKGQVLSDGEPINGVKFVVFSSQVKPKDVVGCDITDLKSLPHSKGQSPLCHVTSGLDGFFQFPALPSGNYRLVPVYVGERIKFDVVPGELEFTVERRSLLLKEPFQVAGFTVSGQALSMPKGMGIAYAAVKINGKEVTRTKEDGSFTLDSMKAGTYTMDVESKNIFFDSKEIKISPNNPQLPDMIATRFAACGWVKVDKFPETDSVNPDLSKRKITIMERDSTSLIREIYPHRNGRFCADLKPGFYTFRVEIMPDEVKAGLKLSPLEHEIEVKAMPTPDIVFQQMWAKVRGTIQCLEKCRPLQLTLANLGRAEDRDMVQAVVDGKIAKFEFENVMPGRYRVGILNEEWCWREKSMDVEVIDRDVSGLVFTHAGYILACSISHHITLNFSHTTAEEGGSFNLSKGLNKFCLKEPGVYKLTPLSCHKFEQDTYIYDTGTATVLTLAAIRHLVEGSITLKHRHDDMKLTIKSSMNADKPTVIEPLKPEGDTTEEKGGKSVVKQAKQGPFVYKFNYWAKSREKLQFIPSAPKLLFYPPMFDVTIRGDSCMGEVAKFDGKEGVFIDGQITPPLEGVDITIVPGDKPDEKIVLKSDNKGLYREGPLHPGIEYQITASKENYIFNPVTGKQGHFKALKLGQVSVKVLDGSDQPLQNVLLSLAGGMNYRSNNLTHKDGAIDFTSLSPGQYFLRPMMKEYEFEPSSQMIEVAEGSTVPIKIKAKRVAFSCYGIVNSLNGEPEQGIHVEAVGLNTDRCTQLQEETKSEPDGTFRIRGLQPECTYAVKLKLGDVNQHIERSTPKNYTVKVDNKDIEGLRLIAFRRINQMDLTGSVKCPEEHLHTLKVSLYKEKVPDQPLYTVNLAKTFFFFLPTISRDSESYFIKFESSLSRSLYDYKLPYITFVANRTYKHFKVTFQPTRKILEQELNQSSFLILPLTFLVIMIAYNYQKMWPWLEQLVTGFQTVLQKSTQASSASTSQPEPSQYDISPELLTELTQHTKRSKKPKKVS